MESEIKSLTVFVFILFCRELQEYEFSMFFSLRSTALNWFGAESWWPVVFPHWELPYLPTLCTSTIPCSRTPHSPPVLWVLFSFLSFSLNFQLDRAFEAIVLGKKIIIFFFTNFWLTLTYNFLNLWVITSEMRKNRGQTLYKENG